MNVDARPDPNILLSEANRLEYKKGKGKLKIFFGYSAGVGKTYTMLREAHDLKESKKDVVIGYIEPHMRPETTSLLRGIDSIALKQIQYKGITFKEFDLDEALKRRPEIILVDELAHTNANGQRYKKRWQDIEELLNKGIDVYTTLNVQHIESLNDVVASITNITVRETIPDKVFDDADKVELIDIEPEELLKRFSEGKIYSKEQTKKAFGHFFTKNNLYALREIALRRTADRVSNEIETERLSKGQITVMPTSDQILACISSSPSSLRVIRTAARFAEAFHTKWIVLYIETTKFQNLKNSDKDRLSSYLNLAEQLGGEVATVYGDDLAEEIIEYAEFRNITKIIIGKNSRVTSKIVHFYARDVVDKLMNSNSYIDVYVVPSAQDENRKFNLKSKIHGKFSISLQDIIKAIIIMCISTFISKFFDIFHFSDVNMIMVYILGVIIVYMITTGYIVGIMSSIVSVLAFNYLFTKPKYSFEFYDKSYWATFPIMITVALIIGTLTNRVQIEAKESSERENRTQTLYRISRKLLSANSIADVVAEGIKYISRLLNRTVVCYIWEDGKMLSPFVYNSKEGKIDNNILNKEEQAAAQWTFINKKESGAGTNTFYGAKGYYMPIKGQKNILGVIGASCIKGKLLPKHKFIFETVASQMAIAIEREIFSKNQESSKIEIERERLRSTLLRSISHDLRSPLAGIKGSISTILENDKSISKEVETNLLKGVYDDTEWLIRLVENLLSMTRFDEGKMELVKNIEAAEEVVYEAVQRSSKQFKDCKIKVDIPDNFILVPMDARLIEQVLINLIDNAVKHSPKHSEIIVKVYEKNKDVIFEVIDNGTGISSKILPNIFERFFTDGSKISDSRRGVGLGLAICKSIVEAHGGKISAFNRKDRGAVFRFNIPEGSIMENGYDFIGDDKDGE
ncbi:MAG: sensor histidine kinase KdpD [Clostridium sp.]|nr:sensor histidine kinase KdpD [Clostridium sp.]